MQATQIITLIVIGLGMFSVIGFILECYHKSAVPNCKEMR